jgi:hypothetical protein
MSKILKITDGDYTVKTGYAGTITLHTGSGAGRVVVTGSLDVQGDFTTVQSETLTIVDQKIELNVGESGPGVTSKPTDTSLESGLLIHRGANNTAASRDVLVVFKEVEPKFPSTTITGRGTVQFKYSNGEPVAISTNSITVPNNGNLGLINAGDGVVTVSGTDFYEKNAFRYTEWEAAGSPRGAYANPNALITVIDGDIIPNSTALKDFVDAALYYYRSPLISEGDTSVRTYDDSISGGASRIEFKVNNALRGQFIDTGLDVDNVNIFTNTINNATNNLILTSTAANNIVQVDAVLQLDDTGLSPTSVAGSTKIYTVNSDTTPAPGKTGIYFTNQGNSDELVAKNRALLFSVLF